MVTTTGAPLNIPIPEDDDPAGLLAQTVRDGFDHINMLDGAIAFPTSWSYSGGGSTDQGVGAMSRSWYQQIGANHLQVGIWVKLGAAPTFGAGAWRFSLPFDALIPDGASGPMPFTGDGWILDSSSGDLYRLFSRVLPSDAGTWQILTPGTTAGGPVRGVSSATPFAVGANDEFYATLTYLTADFV